MTLGAIVAFILTKCAGITKLSLNYLNSKYANLSSKGPKSSENSNRHNKPKKKEKKKFTQTDEICILFPFLIIMYVIKCISNIM